MSDYTVNVKYAVDSSGLKNATNEAEKLSRKLKETAGNAAPIGKNLEDSLGKIKGVSGLATGGIEGLETAILGATTAATALAAGVVVVVGALAALSFNNLKSIHEINEIAEVSGVAAEKMAQMAAVAAREGIGVEDFGIIINKTAKAVTEAVESNSQLAKTFTDLGLSTRELQNLSPDEKFLKIFDAIQKVNEQGKKFEAVTQIFGKSAVDILKVASSAEDFKNRMAEASKTGEAASQTLLDKAAEQDKQLKELAGKWVQVKNKITEVFAPAITAGLDTIVGLIDGQAGAWDRVLRFLNPVYAIYRAMGGGNMFGKAQFGLLAHVGMAPGSTLSASDITSGADTFGIGKPVAPAGPVDNTTEAEKAAKAAAAAAKAKAAADAAAAKAAAEAKRVQEAYNAELKKTVTIVRDLNEGSKTDGFLRDVQEQAPQLVEQFNAAVSTAKQAGLEIENWHISADKAHITLDTKIGPALEEIAAKAGKTTEELKKQADLAVQTAEAREHEAVVAGRHVEIAKTTTDYNTKAAISVSAIAEINAGRITTEAELAKYIEDQAFYADLTLKAKNGATDADIAALQSAHDLAEAQGKNLDATKQKAFDALDASKNFYTTFTNGFVDTFVDGLARGKLEWKKWLADLANQLLKSYLLKLLSTYLPMLGSGYTNTTSGTQNMDVTTSSGFSGPRAMGGAFNNGYEFFANGGVVNRTTPFGMANGRWGIMGEAGPEAIMPLTRGPNGKLGVAAHGGLGTQVINLGNTTINVQSTSDTARDDRETAKAIDKMLEDKMNRWLREQRRSGNQLNPNFGYSY